MNEVLFLLHVIRHFNHPLPFRCIYLYKAAAQWGIHESTGNLPRCKGPLCWNSESEMEQLTGGAAAAKAYGYSSRPNVVKLDVVSSSFEGLGRSRVMVLVIAALLPALIVLHFHYVMQRRRNLPPGPWPWPIFGNLPDMGMASKELPHRYFRALADKFGGLMYLQLGMMIQHGNPFILLP